ncbi:hypothetical protein QQX98_003717 [Neonectria punicea]|uniref:Uncharacterized protein n=1 Tax=Neonectria punicea TaxID=979145 RepID=A0ABR1HCJ0_9HYPO
MRFPVMITALAVVSTAAAVPAAAVPAAVLETGKSSTIKCCCCDIRIKKTVCTLVPKDQGCFCTAVVCPDQPTPSKVQPAKEKA